MTDTRHTNKPFNVLNALALPLILLILTIASQAAGRPILPQSLTPTFPETVPGSLAYPELLGLFAISLVCFNSVRWPVQVALYLLIGLASSALASTLSNTPLLTPFSVTCAAWYGLALPACFWNTVNPTFGNKYKIIAGAALLILFVLNIPISYLLFNQLDGNLTVSILPSLIGITVGIAGGLILMGASTALSKALGKSAGTFLLRPASPVSKEAPAKSKQQAPAAKKPSPAPARKATPAPPPAPRPTPAPAPAAARASSPASEKTAPSTSTDKLLCSTDVPEIEIPNRPAINRNKKKPSRPAPNTSSSPSPKKPSSNPKDDDSDWLNKHLEALNK